MNLKIIKCYGNKYISLKIISLNVKLNKNEDLDNTLKVWLIVLEKRLYEINKLRLLMKNSIN